MIKSCPRCSRDFECRSDDIFNCDCINIPLSKEDLVWLAQNYEDCLCTACLKVISEIRVKKTIFNPG